MTSNCAKCGKKNNDAEHYQLKEKDKCFNCNFWSEMIDKKPLVINGDSYMDGGSQPASTPSYLLGFAGRKFRYRKLGETEWIITNNMWYQGTIPEVFRNDLPDNAEFENVTKHNIGGTICFDVR